MEGGSRVRASLVRAAADAPARSRSQRCRARGERGFDTGTPLQHRILGDGWRRRRHPTVRLCAVRMRARALPPTRGKRRKTRLGTCMKHQRGSGRVMTSCRNHAASVGLTKRPACCRCLWRAALRRPSIFVGLNSHMRGALMGVASFERITEAAFELAGVNL